jgi:hypothetical protein
MGYVAVKTMVAHLKGQPVEKRIDTGVQRRDRRPTWIRRDEGTLEPDLKK